MAAASILCALTGCASSAIIPLAGAKLATYPLKTTRPWFGPSGVEPIIGKLTDDEFAVAYATYNEFECDSNAGLGLFGHVQSGYIGASSSPYARGTQSQWCDSLDAPIGGAESLSPPSRR
jgi:hypothetical protein